MESARNLFLLHLNKNQKSNGFLLQVCQTDAVPGKADAGLPISVTLFPLHKHYLCSVLVLGLLCHLSFYLTHEVTLQLRINSNILL